jgi:hypothetical protein
MLSLVARGELARGESFGGAEGSVVVADFSGGLDAAGVPEGWKLVRNTGRPDLRVRRDGAIAALEMHCAKASFGLQRELPVNPSASPFLSWKWKVDELPEGGDFRSGRTDDQAAQLYVAFSRTRVIAYIWDTTAPAGTVGDAIGIPFVKVKVFVLRSGKAEAGHWLHEERNLLEDYRSAFGEEVPDARNIGIRLQINSQHTGTEADSSFADIVLRAGRSG